MCWRACGIDSQSGVSVSVSVLVWIKPVSITYCACLFCSFSPTAMHLPLAQTTPHAGCLTCVPTRSWWSTPMTTSSAASHPWLSPRVDASCWPDMMILTATCGTHSRPTVPVSRHTPPFQNLSCDTCNVNILDLYCNILIRMHTQHTSLLFSCVFC